MNSFELLSSDHFLVIIHSDKKNGLIFNRIDGSIDSIKYDDAKELTNVKPIGRAYGIVGKFLDNYLVLIKNRAKVGSLYEPITKLEHDVFVITQVQAISILKSSASNSGQSRDDLVSSNENVNQPQRSSESADDAKEIKDDDYSSLPDKISSSSYTSAQTRANNWNPFKIANSLRPMMPTNFLKATLATTTSEDVNQDVNTESLASQQQSEDSDKRLVDEMIKLFNNTNSFYFSPTLDLTNRFSKKPLSFKSRDDPLWRTANERYFWNKYMLSDLIKLAEHNNQVERFICVILQGFIAIEERSPSVRHFEDICEDKKITDEQDSEITGVDVEECNREPQPGGEYYRRSSDSNKRSYQLAIVSRRSIFHAGTRYRRRGCDEKGNCANFVETEQIFRSGNQFTSFVQIRGSIPLFWYQTGFNYRPPPMLCRTEEENREAFMKHFSDLIESYSTEQIIVVDCTEQQGREKAIHDAYKSKLMEIQKQHPKIRLIEFDFHRYCRGRQGTEVLVEKHLRSCGLTDQILKDSKYYWNDGAIVCDQEGVFRVNCLDCSDRTNVVQRAIALQVLDMQLARLSIIPPDTQPECNEYRRIMQNIWAANGNALSTQYCGTRALFGGDRKLSGYIKDTYSSASRYYISKFRDAYRQAAIDAMLGVESVENKLKSGNINDHYEILGFDPTQLAGRTGSALLKDVGTRFTNRLSRLKGRLNVGLDSLGVGTAGNRTDDAVYVRENDIIETRLSEMNIDWPTPEGSDSQYECEPGQNVFECFPDDCFQDDDVYGSLMLSLDIEGIQKLREEESSQDSSIGKEKEKAPEEIDMKETRNVMKTGSSSEQDADGITTTSTTTT